VYLRAYDSVSEDGAESRHSPGYFASGRGDPIVMAESLLRLAAIQSYKRRPSRRLNTGT
jgi:hypothetical protein